MIEWPFLFPFAALSENFALTQLSVFFESDSNFDSGQNSKERSISKLRFKTFFIERKKTSSLFHFSSTCTICTCVHSATNCFWNAKKFLNIKLKEFKIFKMDLHLPSPFVKTPLGNIIPS